MIWACGPTLDTTLASIEGRWTTTEDARYTDRAFEIEEDFLYLLQGGDTFSVHRIHDFQITDQDLPLYTIEYRGDEGALFLLRVYLSPEDGGTLFFSNDMNTKWHRDPDASVPWGALLDSKRDTGPPS